MKAYLNKNERESIKTPFQFGFTCFVKKSLIGFIFQRNRYSFEMFWGLFRLNEFEIIPILIKIEDSSVFTIQSIGWLGLVFPYLFFPM